ncbi:universal stress protein [Acinetobacter sp. CAAS 2-6]|uniref:universal stress protein n=1 Tax=Acinetobacter sp. CAAS 2-6 TaxID=3016358 RepID=UPI002DD6B6D5|nr:universal stress protein [Acinetobacter sp. CAAS 2-6]
MAYQHILVPIDGSETSFLAVQQAAEFAKAFGSKVTVVEVLLLDPYIADEYIRTGKSNSLIERAREYLVKNLQQAKAKFAEVGLDVETKLLEGESVKDQIVQGAQDLQADLIIIGSHGRSGLKKFILGSVAQGVLNETSLPVLVVR